jgi:hypothetical protein
MRVASLSFIGVIRVFRGQKKAAHQRRTPKYPYYQCDPWLKISIAAGPRWVIRGWSHADHPEPQATKSACKPCGELSLDFFMRNAFATVELIHPFLDCRKKFDLLGDFLQRDFIGQLANDIQHNFFLAHVDEYARPLEAKQTARSSVIASNQQASPPLDWCCHRLSGEADPPFGRWNALAQKRRQFSQELINSCHSLPVS